MTEVFLTLTEVFVTLIEGFPCFFLCSKANTSVKFAKIGHGPHSSKLVVICVLFCAWFMIGTCAVSGPGSSVGIATGYGLGGPGSNAGGDEIFRPCLDRPWGPPSLLSNGYLVFPGVKCGRGVLLTTHPLLVPRSWKSRAIPLPTLWATPGL